MSHLIENAIEFLARAIDEFQSQPKYSIINFYTAVELFLKARLLHEHWSLVVSKDPDRQKFETGDFASVTFDEACSRLQKVVQSPIPDSARKNFETIRKHRNKMVHFFHQGRRSDFIIEAIAREQLRAWYDLNQLLTVQWVSVFQAYGSQLAAIEAKLRGHREYLRAKYDSFLPSIAELRSRGVAFRTCGSCGFEAAQVSEKLGDLLQSKCLVCGYQVGWFDYECTECGERSPLYEGGEFNCARCGHKEDEQMIIDGINEFIATKHNYFEAEVPANCSECQGYHTVVEYKDHYLCVVCFALTDALEACGWCAEFNNGDMEDSDWKGCSVCDGKKGWESDRDD